ncbi:MAG: SHOCT domain-containing protein [Thermosipho sp. (in: Bacteria)]|nr:SHOCT domain-containing protein [Thermosipho sp. (in: thermotogales)]
MHYWFYGPHLWTGGWLGWIGALIGLAVMIFFIVLVYKLFKYLFSGINSTNNSYGNSTKTSLEILNERLAKGEITVEEYEKMKKILLKS